MSSVASPDFPAEHTDDDLGRSFVAEMIVELLEGVESVTAPLFRSKPWRDYALALRALSEADDSGRSDTARDEYARLYREMSDSVIAMHDSPVGVRTRRELESLFTTVIATAGATASLCSADDSVDWVHQVVGSIKESLQKAYLE